MTFFGIDLMFDSEWNPYLLEANNSPSFVAKTPEHKKVIDNLVNNMLNI